MEKNYNAQKRHLSIPDVWKPFVRAGLRRLLIAFIPIAIGTAGCGAVYAQAWVNVGNAGFSAGQADGTTIAIGVNDTPYVAYEDWGTGKSASVMKLDGSIWVNVGLPGFSAGNVDNPCIAINGSGTPYVVYQDASILTGNA